ncbi:hypothetical protein BD289DRAFT_483497 [Coniella lustricola]|uniref:Uncharacterized protein n=1 Tax=Coniella lustricola TaxID=2025994 RepID=A0A2T3A571_9PEZI|nr:hypothetical protein BD289DRAFT_483497 [Coniella lustricola]
MSSNNDHPMVRFLFAILQQECIKTVMKNVDWNLVAHNPILSQEISNGHAARMRYSRFRASLLNIEPQRRSNNPKNKATKSRKDKINKLKKEKRNSTKPDGDATPDDAAQDPMATPISTKNEAFVKQEPLQHHEPCHIDTNIAPAELQSLPIPTTESQMQFYKPYMSPPSDKHTDLFAPVYGLPLATSPVDNIVHHEPMFQYPAASTGHCAYEQNSWRPSPSYSPYTLAYEVETFNTPAPFSDHQHTALPEVFGMVPDPVQAVIHIPNIVKHEEMDTRLH